MIHWMLQQMWAYPWVSIGFMIFLLGLSFFVWKEAKWEPTRHAASVVSAISGAFLLFAPWAHVQGIQHEKAENEAFVAASQPEKPQVEKKRHFPHPDRVRK